MSTFQSLSEAVSRFSVTGESRAIGTYLKQGNDFWKTLSLLSNHDPEGLAEILGSNPADVATWNRKIDQVAKQAGKAKEEKARMLPTGNIN